MNLVEFMRVFARMKSINDPFCKRMPFNYNIATAMHGFHDMGIEIIEYNTVGEIYDEYRRGDIVLDGIQQVEYCLAKYGIKPFNDDYPEIFQPYMGRKIWTDKLSNVTNISSEKGIFIKPLREEKKFIGRVIKSPTDLVGCGCQNDDTEIVCSEPVDFVFECRGFFYYDDLIDLRPYKGDWRQMKNLDTNLIDEAVKKYANSEDKLNACSLDWGVTSDGRTLFIEQNLFFACGCYGLQQNQYAKMISAYISQISDIPDECMFV